MTLGHLSQAKSHYPCWLATHPVYEKPDPAFKPGRCCPCFHRGSDAGSKRSQISRCEPSKDSTKSQKFHSFSRSFSTQNGWKSVEYCPGAEKISAQGTGASIASSAPIYDIQVWLQCGFMRPLTMSHPGGRRGKMREVLPCDFSMVMY